MSYREFSFIAGIYKEYGHKSMTTSLELFNKINNNLDNFSSNLINYWFNQSFFFKKTTIHHNNILSYKKFYNLNNKFTIFIYNNILLSRRINDNFGISIDFFHNTALKKIDEKIYTNYELKDKFTYEIYGLTLNNSWLINKLLIKNSIEAGLKNYLKILYKNPYKELYLIYDLYSDYPIGKFFYLSGNLNFLFPEKSINEWSCNISLNYKL